MRFILTKQVNRWFKRHRSLTSNMMKQAADEVVNGNNDGKLTDRIFKKRIATNSNAGRRSGGRMIVGFVIEGNFYYLFAYNKNQLENITSKDENAINNLFNDLKDLNNETLNKYIEKEILFEI